MTQKGSASLILIALIILVASLFGAFFYLQNTKESPKKIVASPDPTPSNNPSSAPEQEKQDFRVNTYSLEELKGIVKGNSKDSCIQTILPLVHAFPGYKYKDLTGVMRDGDHLYDEKANVLIYLTGEGLINAKPLEDFSEDLRKDSYTFEMYYDEAQDTCKISNRSNIFDWLFPQQVSDEAKELAKKEAVVQQFFDKYKNPHISYVDWLEVGRSEYTNNRDILRLVSDKNSIYVYLGLSGEIENTQFGVSVPVLVDIKNKKVIVGEETVADRTPK